MLPNQRIIMATKITLCYEYLGWLPFEEGIEDITDICLNHGVELVAIGEKWREETTLR